MIRKWFQAAPGQEPRLWDALGRVRATVYFMQTGESLADAIATAQNCAAKNGSAVCVFDADETFAGTAIAFDPSEWNRPGVRAQARTCDDY